MGTSEVEEESTEGQVEQNCKCLEIILLLSIISIYFSNESGFNQHCAKKTLRLHHCLFQELRTGFVLVLYQVY